MSTFCQTSGIRGPTSGCKGTVVLTFEDIPSSKVGVKFDAPVPDGVDFAGLCDRGHGYFCHGKFVISLISFHFTCIVYNLLCFLFLLSNYFVSVVKELCLERMSEEDLYKLLIPRLFEACLYICSTS